MRALTPLQSDVLRALQQHGSWHESCGWTWDTTSGTKRVLESLLKHGLVVKTIEGRGRLGAAGPIQTTVYRPWPGANGVK